MSTDLYEGTDYHLNISTIEHNAIFCILFNPLGKDSNFEVTCDQNEIENFSREEQGESFSVLVQGEEKPTRTAMRPIKGKNTVSYIHLDHFICVVRRFFDIRSTYHMRITNKGFERELTPRAESYDQPKFNPLISILMDFDEEKPRFLSSYNLASPLTTSGLNGNNISCKMVDNDYMEINCDYSKGWHDSAIPIPNMEIVVRFMLDILKSKSPEKYQFLEKNVLQYFKKEIYKGLEESPRFKAVSKILSKSKDERKQVKRRMVVTYIIGIIMLVIVPLLSSKILEHFRN